MLITGGVDYKLMSWDDLLALIKREPKGEWDYMNGFLYFCRGREDKVPLIEARAEAPEFLRLLLRSERSKARNEMQSALRGLMGL
jgi:hypothetical protein